MRSKNKIFPFLVLSALVLTSFRPLPKAWPPALSRLPRAILVCKTPSAQSYKRAPGVYRKQGNMTQH